MNKLVFKLLFIFASFLLTANLIFAQYEPRSKTYLYDDKPSSNSSLTIGIVFYTLLALMLLPDFIKDFKKNRSRK